MEPAKSKHCNNKESKPHFYEPVLGYFIFIQLGHGILASKFGNRIHNQLFSEGATRLSLPHPDDLFVGVDATTWIDRLQPFNRSRAWLLIEHRQDPARGQYLLMWFSSADTDNRVRNNILFWGEGMLVDEQLVGADWDVRIQGILF